MQSSKAGYLPLLAALAVLSAGCLGGAPGAASDDLAGEVISGPDTGTSGGNVQNAAPSFQSFAGSLTTADNSGSSVETFTGRVFDANGERDFESAMLYVNLSGAATASAGHQVTLAEATATTEPATHGADGWKVWSDVLNDGVLHFKYRYTYEVGTSPGTYTFTPAVKPLVGHAVSGPTDSTTVEVFSEITIASAPVGADGSASSTNTWGLWQADPGAANVASTNYVKLTNTGQEATASVVLDFTEANFTGEDDANFTIPIEGNIQFAWWEDTTPDTTSPSEEGSAYAWLATSGEGSVTVTFTGLGNVIYVQYRVVQLPEVLAIQPYGASYTATEV